MTELKRMFGDVYAVIDHEPGVQKGYGMGKLPPKKVRRLKLKDGGSASAQGNARKLQFWPVGRWAGGWTDGRRDRKR